MASSSKPNSRFSTLKAFKFNQPRDADSPPPPPPKDDYYLNNRSLNTLSPDSIPSTPMSTHSGYGGQQSAWRPSNHSAVSLVSEATSGAHTGETSAAGSGKKSGVAKSLFKFGKRSPKSPSIHTVAAEENHSPSQSQEDEAISLPWNFQVS